jgi:hypothetical protein
VAWASGPRAESLAETVVTTTRDRTGSSQAITYVTDGWEVYETNPNWAVLVPNEEV